MWYFHVRDVDNGNPIKTASFNYPYATLSGDPGWYVLGYPAWKPYLTPGTVVQVSAPGFASCNVTVWQTWSSWDKNDYGVVEVSLKSAYLVGGSPWLD
jgi:hypothetical protein